MNCENKIGGSFDSLAQRIIYVTFSTFPNYVPVQSDLASEPAQRQMYNFLLGVISKLYENPTLLDLPIEPDDSYENWMVNNRKPELIKSMRKVMKNVDNYYTFLYNIGNAGVIHDNRLIVNKGEMRITSKMVAYLAKLGIKSDVSKEQVAFYSDEYPDMVPAWKLLSSVASQNPKDPGLLFSRCIYDITHKHPSEIYAHLSGNEDVFQALEQFFIDNGYERMNYEEALTRADNEICVSWHKNFNKKDAGGIKIWFDFRKVNQIAYELQVPRFRELVYQFEDMDKQLKDLVIARTKKCDACGYCIQTDRTRKMMTVQLTHEGQTHAVCPFFPAITWNYIDNETVTGMTKLLRFAETKYQD